MKDFARAQKGEVYSRAGSTLPLESGLRKKVVEEYLQLLLDSGIYRKHHVGRGRKMLLTEVEFQRACAEGLKDDGE